MCILRAQQNPIYPQTAWRAKGRIPPAGCAVRRAAKGPGVGARGRGQKTQTRLPVTEVSGFRRTLQSAQELCVCPWFVHSAWTNTAKPILLPTNSNSL